MKYVHALYAPLATLCLALAPLPAAALTVAGQVRVVDGDTVDIRGQKVRLLGIDAPESAQRCNGLPCGQEATAFLKEMVAGQDVTCEGEEFDAYDRLLGHCFVGKQDIGSQMVQSGHAAAYVRYSDDYLPLQVEAYESGRGMWQNGVPQMPWDYRHQRWQVTAQEAPRPGCPIKGNINARGQRIYHTPYSQFYEQTIIRTEFGERWFCSEAEALAAGWRAPLR